MSEVRDRIKVQLNALKPGERITVFVRREDLAHESLDRIISEHVSLGWFVICRQVKNNQGVWGLTFTRDKNRHYGPNPNFVSIV